MEYVHSASRTRGIAYTPTRSVNCRTVAVGGGWQRGVIPKLGGVAARIKDIATLLFVSPRTVSTHLYRIYPKLGISARSQLAVALSETP